jgi:predicted transcriptional regulator
VDDLDRVRVGEDPAEEGQVRGRVEGIDEVDALLRPDLQQAELLPK